MGLLIIILLLLSSVSLQAQIPEVRPHSYLPGGVTSIGSQWLPLHNPSALAREREMRLQMQYDNRFISYELSTELVALAVPTKYLNVGVALSFFGFSEYHELLVASSFAKQFGERFLLGVEAVAYLVYLSPSRRYASTVFANVGMQFIVNESLQLGVSVENPFAQKITSDEFAKVIPTTVALGTSYRPMTEVTCLFQISASAQGGVHAGLGVEYEPFSQVLFRAGAYAQRGSVIVPTLGVGYRFGRFAFNLHSEWLPRVGISVLGHLSYRIT